MITSFGQALEILDEVKAFIFKSMTPDWQFEQLKAWLKHDDWPSAVPQMLLCSSSEEDKFERAASIIDFTCGNINGKKFLDFGCGLGHVAVKASKLGAIAVGYDIKSSTSFEWEKEDNKYLLTTDFERVKKLAPFDTILLYDVLDHAENSLEVLQQVKGLCGPQTEVFVRCHPFISRHGGHLYNKINKAFVHLVFTKDELKSMGCDCDVLQELQQPLVMYHQWLSQVGFRIIDQNYVSTDAVESFFQKNVLVASRLPDRRSLIGVWKHSVNGLDQIIPIFPNGKIKTIDSYETWELDGLRLVLRWPRTNGGTWVDNLWLNPEMTHYEGKNQSGFSIKGDKMDDMQQSFVDFALKIL